MMLILLTTQTNECFSSFRQLWLWMHASAFNEGCDALKFACQKLVNYRDYLSLIFFPLLKTLCAYLL